jgi:hypothetical protein
MRKSMTVVLGRGKGKPGEGNCYCLQKIVARDDAKIPPTMTMTMMILLPLLKLLTTALMTTTN